MFIKKSKKKRTTDDCKGLKFSKMAMAYEAERDLRGSFKLDV